MTIVSKTVDVLFLCCLSSQLATASKDLRGNITGLVYSFVAGISLARITQLLDTQNIIKPNLMFKSDNGEMAEVLTPWKFGKDIKEIIADSECILHTCPVYSDKSSLLEQDVKLCESYVLAVLNECTRQGIEKDEAMRMCMSTIFGLSSKDSPCLGIEDILLNKNTQGKWLEMSLPVVSLVKMACEETLLEKKIKEDEAFRRAFMTTYQKVIQKYSC